MPCPVSEYGVTSSRNCEDSLEVKIFPRNHSDQGQKRVRRQGQNRKWNPHGRGTTTLTEEEVTNPEASLASHTTQKSKFLRRILETATDMLPRSGEGLSRKYR